MIVRVKTLQKLYEQPPLRSPCLNSPLVNYTHTKITNEQRTGFEQLMGRWMTTSTAIRNRSIWWKMNNEGIDCDRGLGFLFSTGERLTLQIFNYILKSLLWLQIVMNPTRTTRDIKSFRRTITVAVTLKPQSPRMSHCPRVFQVPFPFN